MKSPLNGQNGSQNQLSMLETFKIMIFDQIQSKVLGKVEKNAHILIKIGGSFFSVHLVNIVCE